tara:strand:+ start:1154 stop:1405 length:252 start_codon:yes stop_codon:yes gene_type:complete
MSNSKDGGCLTIETIQRNIPASSEINQPFPKYWIHVWNWTPCLRLARLYFHACPQCFDSTAGCIAIFYGKKAIEPLYVGESWR